MFPLKTKQTKDLNIAVGERISSFIFVTGHWFDERAIGFRFLTARCLTRLHIFSFQQLFGCGINYGI
jgi:hypothetical protein